MGMFDNITVKLELPLTEELKALDIDWKEEVFQTKDLDNLLDLYEITEEGKLKHLAQEREWKKDDSSFLGGHLDVVSEKWEELPYHGVVRFYTSHCDSPKYNDEFYSGEKKPPMSWQEIFDTPGFDWWIEFLAIFDNGAIKEIRIEKIDKTPISARLAANKEWELRREMRDKELVNRIVKRLKKIPGYNSIIRCLYRAEQKCHDKLSGVLRKIS
jgi:hypothetical protein